MAVLSALHEQAVAHSSHGRARRFSVRRLTTVARGQRSRAGRRVFLTAAEAEQMRYVPELVFINCCHLGQTARRLAAARSTAWRPTSGRSSSRWAPGPWSPRDGRWTMRRRRRSRIRSIRRCSKASPFGEAVARARATPTMLHVRPTRGAHTSATAIPRSRWCASRPADSVRRGLRFRERARVWLDRYAGSRAPAGEDAAARRTRGPGSASARNAGGTPRICAPRSGHTLPNSVVSSGRLTTMTRAGAERGKRAD